MTNFVDSTVESFTNEQLQLLTQQLNKVQFGLKPVKRGIFSNDLISYEISSDFKLPKKFKSNNNFSIKKGNMNIIYSYNPNSEKQGKMDVQLNYGQDTQYDYRVSAKRWTNKRGNVGYTSIDAGLTRACGQSVAEAYKFAVLTPKKDQFSNEKKVYLAYDIAHQLAHLAIKSDLLMGLNQGISSSGAGYANILVVDTGVEIKVENLGKIALDATKKLNGYNEGNIQSIANNNYKLLKNIQNKRTSTYLALMTSSLNKIKVTLNLSFK